MKTFYIDVNSIAWLGMPGHTQPTVEFLDAISSR